MSAVIDLVLGQRWPDHTITNIFSVKNLGNSNLMQAYIEFLIREMEMGSPADVHRIFRCSSSSSSIIVRPLSRITTMWGVHTAQGV